jgi:hypothetical protein
MVKREGGKNHKVHFYSHGRMQQTQQQRQQQQAGFMYRPSLW